MKPFIILSDSPWQSVPSRTQHLATRLRSTTVLFFEPAPNGRTAPKEQGRQVRPNLFVYTLPAIPTLFHQMPFLLARAQRRQGQFINQVMTKLGHQEAVVWCSTPAQQTLLPHLTMEHSIVYDCDRDWSHLEQPWEADLAASADVIFAASPWLRERLSPCNRNIALLPNGVNYPMFARPTTGLAPELKPFRGAVLGFMGAITADLDLAPLEYTALGHPEWDFVLLGRLDWNPRLANLEQLPNVHFLGHKSSTELPDYIGRFDVCLELRRDQQAMDDVLPSRMYEYLSTGKPVVTLLFPDQVEEFPDVVYGAHSLEEFDLMCLRALKEDKTWVAPRRQNYGQDASWSNRAATVQDILTTIGLYEAHNSR